jgi:gliding motility-associated-like protein
MNRAIVAIIFILIASIRLFAQTELVINGGYETWPGTEWVRVNPADGWVPDAQRTPHGGSYHFYPQNTVSDSSELYQDIGLTSYATSIDAGTANFTFSGWRRGYRNTTPISFDNDRSQIIVEYRNASNTVLDFFDTGSAVFSLWTQSTDTRNAPIGTRSVRIRLISVRVSGSDNDGYYDDISFIYNNPPTTCTPPTTLALNLNTTTSYCEGSTIDIFMQSISPISPNYYYTWIKNGVPLAPASLSYVPLSFTNVSLTDAGTYTLRVEDGNAGLATCYREASVNVLVHPAVVAGTISNNQEICLGETSNPLTGTASTGGIVTKYYKWETATSSIGPWSSIQGYTLGAIGYSPGALIASTYYRRTDSSGVCTPQVTNTIFVRVNNKAIVNTITSQLRDTLCVGENFQLTATVNTLSNPSINGGYYFTWLKKQGTTTTVLSGPSNALNPYPLVSRPALVTDSGQYFLVVQDGLSATECKDTIKKLIVTHSAPIQKAIIQSNQQVCLNGMFNPITEAQASAGYNGTSIYHQWYINTDSTNVSLATKINGANTINFNPGIASNTRYYMRKDSIKYCTSVASNYVELRTNNTPTMDSLYSMSGDTLCVNLMDPFQLKGYLDSTSVGKNSINGGYKFTWYKLQLPATTPVVVSNTSSYVDFPPTSRTVIESDSGMYFLVVQDGLNASTCMDTLKYKVTVLNNCVAITCAKPIDVSIKIASTSNDTLCTGNTFILQQDVINFPVTPPSNGYLYTWIKTTTSGTSIITPASSTYQDLIINPVAETDSGSYQLLVQDGLSYPALCGTLSPSLKLIVHKPIVAALIGNDTSVCGGASINALHTIVNTSGGNGIYNFQWQESIDNISYTNISGATLNTYIPSNNTTRYYRRIENSSTCAQQTSNVVTVTIASPANGGTISTSNTTICYSSQPTLPLTNISIASGGSSATIVYQWQSSIDQLTWNDLIGANQIDYIENSLLTDTLYYRRRAIMGSGICDTAYSNILAINIFAPLDAGTIGNNQNICEGNSITLNEINGTIGGNTSSTYTYQWIESTDNGATWSNAIGNSNSMNYTTPNLVDTIFYKRISNSLCGIADTSNQIQINVDTLSTPIVTVSNLSTCENISLTVNTIVTNAGSSPAILWEKSSTNTGPWTNVSNNASFNINNPNYNDSGMVYRMTITSSNNCNTGPFDSSFVFSVFKTITPQVSIQSNPSGFICDTLQRITYTAQPIQGQGPITTYQWYDGVSNNLITGATNMTYTPSILPQDRDKYYVIMNTNAPCTTSPTATSSTFTLNLLTTPQPIISNNDTLICSSNAFQLSAENIQTGTQLQWYKNGVIIIGATQSTYTIQSNELVGGIYSIEETNQGCSMISNNDVTIQIIPSPIVNAGIDIYTTRNSTVNLQGTVSNAYSYIWNPSTGLSNPSILNPQVTTAQTTSYQLFASDASGLCKDSSSVIIYIKDAIVIPNGFTPNNDNINDRWKIEGLEQFPNASIEIYNRWGTLIWKNEKGEYEWDGSTLYNSNLLPVGTYFYVILLNVNNEPFPYKGYIQLIK